MVSRISCSRSSASRSRAAASTSPGTRASRTTWSKSPTRSPTARAISAAPSRPTSKTRSPSASSGATSSPSARSKPPAKTARSGSRPCKKQKIRLTFVRRIFYDRVCKPGSVIDSHLSRRIVADTLQPPSRKQPGRPCFLCGVAPDRVYSNGRFRTPLGALLPHLSTLTVIHGGFLFYGTFPRVAPAGCYPASRPAKLGLSSRLSARNHLSCSRVTVYHPVYLISTFIHNEIYLLP